MASFTKVVLKTCLVIDMVDWKQKLNTQWVQIEINRVQPGKPGNFLRLGSFPFQCSTDPKQGWRPKKVVWQVQHHIIPLAIALYRILSEVHYDKLLYLCNFVQFILK